MKFTPSVVFDAPEYYVDHFNGRYSVDKCTILRNLQLETDSEAMTSSFKHLKKPTNILDLTNNELIAVPDLYLRTDIHTVLCSRNQIAHLDGKVLPRLIRYLVLANNNITSLEQLKGLKTSPTTLKNLVLRGNQVCHLQGYREFVLRLLPHLEVLDFERVTNEERQRVKKIGPINLSGNAKNSTPSNGATRDKTLEIMHLVVGKMTEEKKKELNEQLAGATSLAEIARIEKLLSGGI